MKHREAYTGRGGQKMSQTNLGKAARCLMAVLLVAHSFALLACSSGEPQVKNLNNTPATCTGPSSASNTGNIGAVIGQALIFSPANVFDSRFPATLSSVTLTFTSATAFSLSNSPPPTTGTATGTAAFGANGALTLTYQGTPAPSPTVFNGTSTAPGCSIQVTAGGVEVGGDRVNATVTVTLTSSTRGTVVSQTFTLQIRIAPDGTLILVNPITGAEVLTNVNVQLSGVVGVS
jgi:hypothetical protein